MSTMRMIEVADLARRIKGTNNYYKELKSLTDDICFFNMYVERNRKSNCKFMLLPYYTSSGVAFKLIYEAYGMLIDNLEQAFNVYVVMESMIENQSSGLKGFTSSQVKEFSQFLKEELDLDIIDFVEYILGCSHLVASVRNELYNIINKE